MGKASCKVRFGMFKWNRSGYVAVMDSSAVQALVESPAERLADACNSGFRTDSGNCYVARPAKGIMAKGYRVYPKGTGAVMSELKNNRLVKNLSSLGGGS